METNQFEAVCKLASDEGWCWDINCTTCGNMLFTYAFKQMSYGQSPEDDDWLINTDVEHEKLFAKYGRPVGPPYYKVPLSDFGKEILIEGGADGLKKHTKETVQEKIDAYSKQI